MPKKGRYHGLAKERTMLLRCKSLEPPMSQLGQKCLIGLECNVQQIVAYSITSSVRREARVER